MSAATFRRPFPPLTPAQRYHLEVYGYVVLENALSTEEVERLKGALLRLFADLDALEDRSGPRVRGAFLGMDKPCHKFAVNIRESDPAITAYATHPYMVSLAEELIGGEARTRVPAEAMAVIADIEPGPAANLRAGASLSSGVRFDLESAGGRLTVRAHGVAAHSSTPWEGRNAITHLAAMLARHDWPPTPASRMVQLIDDLVGTGDCAERFGDLACDHPFMGPLTLVLTRLYELDDGGVEACLNIRCPVGRSREQVESAARTAIEAWTVRRGGIPPGCRIEMGDPYHVEWAPHVPVLVDIYRHYSGQHDAGPVAVGGGTQARLLPNGVNFGPSMPGAAYTGHSDHEFVTVEQLRLNLMMQAAMLVDLAA